MHNLLTYLLVEFNKEVRLASWNRCRGPCVLWGLPLYTLQVQLITNKAQLGQVVAYWGANWCGYNLKPSETTDRLYAKVVNLQGKGVIKLCFFSLSLKNWKLLNLVGGSEHVLQCFTYIGNNHANCLSYFSRGVGQPPTMQLMFDDVWTDPDRGLTSIDPYRVGELMAEPHDMTVGPVKTGRNHRPWYNHFTT